MLAAALLVLGAACALWTLSRRGAGPRARVAGWGLALGFALAGLGAGTDAAGVEAGWGLFNFGFLLLLVSGPTLAVALHREEREPLWLGTLLVLAGFGVLLGAVLSDASFPGALAGLAPFAAGWLALTWRLWPPEPEET